MLLLEPSLSEGTGVERCLSRRMAGIIDRHLARQGRRPLALRACRTDAERLRRASREILDRGLLARDLVVTGSCLSGSASNLPSDLYFHAAAAPDGTAPGYGAQGVALVQYPDLLLDVMMGSSAIFPLFPARRLEGLPQPGDHVDLIDGGFAHNSPVEAAVLWGATHVILVNPTPEVPIRSGHLAGNLGAAFRHLYLQAQLIDVRHKGRVAVFSLRPERPSLCVMDFAGNLIADAIAQGYADARGAAPGLPPHPSTAARFRKETGEPAQWLDVGAGP